MASRVRKQRNYRQQDQQVLLRSFRLHPELMGVAREILEKREGSWTKMLRMIMKRLSQNQNLMKEKRVKNFTNHPKLIIDLAIHQTFGAFDAVITHAILHSTKLD
ncbi:MAG: hypothetical protein EZS28_014161 [Streblomastix strix]|uniref:Uncharacterized protein n=1 Tax=Streblomastix strix TaxID=222440 RepID=A0A5J4W720_9EUKA|nr:MAG: hypothetical protein EZS28_014161 [Streblomastix strix]